MRFLVDECTGPAVSQWLMSKGHEVFSVYDEAAGATDEDILNKAYSENWIVVTNDKDFGEMVFHGKRPHRGVIFLRLKDERLAAKINALERLMRRFPDQIADCFVVVTPKQIRFAKVP